MFSNILKGTTFESSFEYEISKKAHVTYWVGHDDPVETFYRNFYIKILLEK